MKKNVGRPLFPENALTKLGKGRILVSVSNQKRLFGEMI